MDVNGTRFQLILGPADWGRCLGEPGRPLVELWAEPAGASDLAWAAATAELTLRPELAQFVASPFDRGPAQGQRRGAGRDRFGNWYWIDEAGGAIRAFSAGSGRAGHFWAPGDDAACAPEAPAPGSFAPLEAPGAAGPLALAGLAVTADHYLVVGVRGDPASPPGGERAGLLVFDLHAGGPPRRLLWPAASLFEPWDMAPLPDGGLVILDRRNRRYWTLDRLLRPEQLDGAPLPLEPERRELFQPDAGAPRVTAARAFPASVDLAAATPPLADPVAIETMADGSVLVLDLVAGADFSRVYHFVRGAQDGAPASTDAVLRVVAQPAGFRLVGHDIAVLPHEGGERLYVAADDGNQAFAFSIVRGGPVLQLEPVAEFLPMRLFGGRGLVRAGRQAYYDLEESWVPLVAQRRPRYAPEGRLLTWALDGREPQCVWHRLMLDGCIPADTAVTVESRAADDERALAVAEWLPEPAPRLRPDGSELPYLRTPSGARRGTWELLFQQARGRFLQLRLTLRGNGRETPRLRALRAYYPRFSYLERYLPAVYREDSDSASFLDRFLANFEGMYTSLEGRIAAAQLLFDVRSAPPEALDWLASWFGAALDPAWEEGRRRLFIANAIELFRWRGTAYGLELVLRLTLDRCVGQDIFTRGPGGVGAGPSYRIVEQFRTRRGPAVVAGDPTAPARSGAALWAPAQGRAELERRYTAAVTEAGVDPPPSGGDLQLPLREPGGQLGAVWRRFTAEQLGFVPALVAPDEALWRQYLTARYETPATLPADYGAGLTSFAEVPVPAQSPTGAVAEDWTAFTAGLARTPETEVWLAWQAFLARRYRRASALNEAYGTRWEALSAVPLPRRPPPDGPALEDWHSFEATVLGIRQAAHRFTVLIPTPQIGLEDQSQLEAEQQRVLGLARRVIELEKPAHTVFGVKFFWAAFRLGEVRLGSDTLIGAGSRSAFLAAPLALGKAYLGAGYLAPGHPQDIGEGDRLVLGRPGPTPSAPAGS